MTQMYSTGELAKLVNVTVRTVQYYDKRGILFPSQVTEGGRRLYTADDVGKLRLICFLRELDFSIEEIGRLLTEQQAKQLLEVLLLAQIDKLRSELTAKKMQVDTCVNLLDKIKGQSDSSLDFLPAVVFSLKERPSWRALQKRMWLSLFLSLLFFLVLIFWLKRQGDAAVISLIGGGVSLIYAGIVVFLSYHFSRQIAYICPACHHIFQPSYWTFAAAAHTRTTRHLTCPNCQQTSVCLEILAKAKPQTD